MDPVLKNIKNVCFLFVFFLQQINVIDICTTSFLTQVELKFVILWIMSDAGETTVVDL